MSSTYEDLKAQRSKVLQALWRQDYIPSGMEAFSASPESSWDIIERVISSSDYYLLILGSNYGSVAPSGKSWTEQEFDYASRLRLPILVYVGNGSFAPARSDCAQSAFRRRVELLYNVQFWSTTSELVQRITEGLAKAQKQFSRPGWTRDTDRSSSVTLTKPETVIRALQLCEQAATAASGTTVRLQDTFFAQMQTRMWWELLRHQHIETRVLLLDPLSDFARLRASGLGHDVEPVTRVRTAIRTIGRALDHLGGERPPPGDLAKDLAAELSRGDLHAKRCALLEELGSLKRRLATVQGCGKVEFRFCSRYWTFATYHYGATELSMVAPLENRHNVDAPWLHVRDEKVAGHAQNAFDSLWAESHSLPGHDVVLDSNSTTQDIKALYPVAGEARSSRRLASANENAQTRKNIAFPDISSHQLRFLDGQHARLVDAIRSNLVRRMNDCDVLLILGLCRVGSTLALDILHRSNPHSVAIYQPIKSSLRQMLEDVPLDLPLHAIEDTRTLIIKETLGPLHYAECLFSPVRILLDAGVLTNKLRVLFVDRTPDDTFGSWRRMWSHTPVDLFQRFLLSTMSLPDEERACLVLQHAPSYLVYEHLVEQPDVAFRALLRELGMEPDNCALGGTNGSFLNSGITFPPEPSHHRPHGLLDTTCEIFGRIGIYEKLSGSQSSDLLSLGARSHYIRRRELSRRLVGDAVPSRV